MNNFIQHPLAIVYDAADRTTRLIQTIGDMEEQVWISDDQAAEVAKHLAGLAKRPATTSGPKRTTKGTDEHFEAFWRLYPAARRFNKKGLIAKWRTMDLDPEWPAIELHLLANINEWAVSGNKPYQYCPLVTTYINQRRWEAAGNDPEPIAI